MKKIILILLCFISARVYSQQLMLVGAQDSLTYIVYGLSTDPKPVGLPTRSVFMELNTGNHYRSNGTGWTLINDMTTMSAMQSTLQTNLSTHTHTGVYQPVGSYLTAASLSPYLTSATAASTYQVAGSYASATHSHAYNSLTGLPPLFDGNYNSLTNKPTLFTQLTADGLYSALAHTHTGVYQPVGSYQSTLVSGTNIKTINGSSVLGVGDLVVGGSAAWGGITGTLSNQTDLQTALNGKQASGNYVTTAQTVNGVALSGNINVTGSTENASIVANTAAINTTETVIVKTPALPANRLQAGTVIRVTLTGTCTSTAANISTFGIRIGTNGTTADGIVQSAATSVAATSGANIPFSVTFLMTVRTVGAAATSHGSCMLWNNGVTGISTATTGNQMIVPTFTSFNTTTANNIISVTYKSAAITTTCTFTNALIEFEYK